MNWDGRRPLRMRCPHCAAYTAKQTTKTFPKEYRWTDETTPMFKRLNGADISFREREKWCASCQSRFHTVEMAKPYLATLISEVARLERENDEIRRELRDAELVRDELHTGARRMAADLMTLAERDAADFRLAAASQLVEIESR